MVRSVRVVELAFEHAFDAVDSAEDAVEKRG